MVRDYQITAANKDTGPKQKRIAALRESIRRHGRDFGPRTWIRDDLYRERF